MSDRLARHRDYLKEHIAAARTAPLSSRKALLAAMLIDAYVDRLFAEQAGEDDILTYRARLTAAHPALGLVMALCSGRQDVTLTTEAVSVTLADYGRLGVEDFMVSLYNDHSVQRLRLALPDGSRADMLDTLQAAAAELGI